MNNSKKQQKQKPDFYQPFKRIQAWKVFLADLFIGIASWPRLVLEVPLRRDFGERYFSLVTCIWIVTQLALAPYLTLVNWMAVFGLGEYSYYHHFSFSDLPDFSLWQLIKLYPGWYFLLVIFLGAAIKRRYEITRYNKVWDMTRYSYSSGKIYRIFYYPWTIRFSLEKGRWKLGSFHVGFLNRTFTVYASPTRVFVKTRTVEVFLEPLFGLVCGWLIGIFISRAAGYVIEASSVIYALSSVASYYKGDQYFMNENDKRIIGEEYEQTFIDDAPINPQSGYRYIGRRPASQQLRRRLLNTIVGHDDDDDDGAPPHSRGAGQEKAKEKQAVLAGEDES